MNIRPTVDFDDKYLNAKCKVIECIKALNQLRDSSYTTWRMEDKDNAH